MKCSGSIFATLLVSAALSGCVAPDDDLDLGELASELSATSWTQPAVQVGDNLGYPPAMATLDGHIYYVYTMGDSADPSYVPHQLYWHQCSPDACTSPRAIPGQYASDRASVAAFNGRIYMLHTGDTNTEAVWFTSLDPATGVWTPNREIGLTTFGGPPAMAAFNNRLYIVGTSEVLVVRRGVEVVTYPMWYVTMDAAEQLSIVHSIAQESASYPSLAAYYGKLYLAHRNGATARIVVSTLSPNSAWSNPGPVLAGPNGAAIEGDDVQLAESNGYLHLVHRRFNSNRTYWTYFRCAWVPEVAIDSVDAERPLSMASVSGGLELARLKDHALWPYTTLAWYRNRFVAPPPPDGLPPCLATGG